MGMRMARVQETILSKGGCRQTAEVKSRCSCTLPHPQKARSIRSALKSAVGHMHQGQQRCARFRT